MYGKTPLSTPERQQVYSLETLHASQSPLGWRVGAHEPPGKVESVWKKQDAVKRWWNTSDINALYYTRGTVSSPRGLFRVCVLITIILSVLVAALCLFEVILSVFVAALCLFEVILSVFVATLSIWSHLECLCSYSVSLKSSWVSL